MPRSFPTMQSLTSNAKSRGYREPIENETEDSYRENFANWMRKVDPVESTEIRSGLGWDKQSSMGMLIDLLGNSKAKESDINMETIRTEDGRTVMQTAPEHKHAKY